jgi:hypothetical protein
MANTLRDLDKPVADHTLVLNVLRGLNNKYDHLKTYLKRALPFPSFHDVCNDLLLEDITLGVEATSGGLQQRHPLPLPWPPLGGSMGLGPPKGAGEVGGRYC